MDVNNLNNDALPGDPPPGAGDGPPIIDPGLPGAPEIQQPPGDQGGGDGANEDNAQDENAGDEPNNVQDVNAGEPDAQANANVALLLQQLLQALPPGAPQAGGNPPPPGLLAGPAAAPADPPAAPTAAETVHLLIGNRAPIRDPAFPPAMFAGLGPPPQGVAKIQPYDDVDISTWHEWKLNWLRMARIYHWDDVTQIDTIKNYFKGEALRRIVGVQADPGDNILELITKLEHVLVPSVSSAEARGEYHKLVQKPNESAISYRGRASLLLKRAYPERDPETDTEFIFKFVQGIWMDPVRRNSILNFPRTLTQAYNDLATSTQFANEYQSDKARSALHNPKPTVQAMGPMPPPRASTPYPGRSRKSQEELRQEDIKLSRCYYCHTSGHMAGECPAKTPTRGNGYRREQGRAPTDRRYASTLPRPNRHVGYIGDEDSEDEDDLYDIEMEEDHSSPTPDTSAGN